MRRETEKSRGGETTKQQSQKEMNASLENALLNKNNNSSSGMARRETNTAKMSNTNNVAPTLESQSMTPPKSLAPRKPKDRERKRIFVSGVNSLVGQALFQNLRNDHVAIQTGKKANKFVGTLIKKDESSVPLPSDTIKISDHKRKPRSFGKNVLQSDLLVVDLLSGSDLEEAEQIIQILRQPLHEKQTRQQVLVVVSPPYVWAGSSSSETSAASSTQKNFTDADYRGRVPLPRFQSMKNLENLALSAEKVNKNLRVHIVCSGLPFGNGESNEVFYDFFRRAWLSLHPELASLPCIGEGKNVLPTIHVEDLARFVTYLGVDPAAEKVSKKYLLAVDKSEKSSQREIMSAISESLGNGSISNVTLSETLGEDWVEMLTLDLKFTVSAEFENLKSDWHCAEGITGETMKLLNEEFNLFRGLFPLKVFIGGPPASGKTHFTDKLAKGYGIPHLTIKDMIESATKMQGELGDEIRAKIEELKDVEAEKYEKARKKKDPDFDRAACQVRLPNEILCKLVKQAVSSPACMNKGFILDGYPRNQSDAKSIFLNPIPGYGASGEGEEEMSGDETKNANATNAGADQENAGEQEGENKEDASLFPGFTIEEKIVPQYTVIFEADNEELKARAKELPAEKTEGTNITEANLTRRLGVYREQNGNIDSETHIANFFTALIGSEKCMVLDKISEMANEKQTLTKIETLLEQNGKPCCINLITDGDEKFLRKLERKERKQALAQAAEGENAESASGAAADAAEDEEVKEEEVKKQESDSDSDEIGALITRQEEQARRKDQEAAERKLIEEEARKDREDIERKEAAKLEKIRETERDLLDKRSQPIRQYLMDNVVPHLTEGLINLCKDVPDDPTDFLANFLLDRADKLDEELIKQKEEEARLKQAQANGGGVTPS